jgi:hypothetical protein
MEQSLLMMKKVQAMAMVTVMVWLMAHLLICIIDVILVDIQIDHRHDIDHVQSRYNRQHTEVIIHASKQSLEGYINLPNSSK